MYESLDDNKFSFDLLLASNSDLSQSQHADWMSAIALHFVELLSSHRRSWTISSFSLSTLYDRSECLWSWAFD